MKKSVAMALGFFFVILGAIGAVLPLLPTTPFLLLAAYFFSKSSERMHQWLLNLPWAGEIIRDWEEHQAIKLRTKISSLMILVAGVSFSYYWVSHRQWYIKAILLSCAAIGVYMILSQKTRYESDDLIQPVKAASADKPEVITS